MKYYNANSDIDSDANNSSDTEMMITILSRMMKILVKKCCIHFHNLIST